MRIRWVAVILLVSAMPVARAGAQESTAPRVVRASATAWEYGVLEYGYKKDGYAYVFCRATPDGCEEQLAEPEVHAARTIGQAEPRFRHVSDPLARTLAALGRAGWELIGEARFGAGCGDDCRVLQFKRAVFVR
jgi:hypothetical protein